MTKDNHVQKIKQEHVGIIGAGPVGCLTALMFIKRGYSVSIFDYRTYLTSSNDAKSLRSINLALSDRGISSINEVDPDLCALIVDKTIPMKGRMIHTGKDNLQAQPYGLHGEHINSIGRAELNISLVESLSSFQDANKNVELNISFEHKLKNISFNETNDKQICTFYDLKKGVDKLVDYRFDFVIGCDGTYSETRNQFQKPIRMDLKQEYVNRGYIELYIPPGVNNEFLISKNYLHIWPRDNFMLIALPNADGSFTSTFFASWDIFDELESMNEAQIRGFFLSNFEDAMKLMDIKNVIATIKKAIVGRLMCVTCYPYHVDGGRGLIMGDAAHSMVPFYGQGLNCGLEDVKVLQHLLNEYDDNRDIAFKKFSEIRYKDHSSIINLSKNNYKEMSHDVTSKLFLLRKFIDNTLAKAFKGYWIPQYTMVTFRNDIPYSKAERTSQIQKRIVNTLLIILGSSSIFTIIKFLRKFQRKINC